MSRQAMASSATVIRTDASQPHSIGVGVACDVRQPNWISDACCPAGYSLVGVKSAGEKTHNYKRLRLFSNNNAQLAMEPSAAMLGACIANSHIVAMLQHPWKI
jgi:hypothetical protein